jgi:aspartate/glutamate racemase
MEPIRAALAAGWPEAEAMNLLDDSLSVDRARESGLSAATTARIVALARYAVQAGARGILFTCSAFGPAIEQAAAELPVPVLKPNEAMFAEALQRGRRLGMLATFGPSVATMEEELRGEAARQAPGASLRTIVVPAAMEALKAGDGAAHDRLLAERAPELEDCDAVMLAQFSTARAAAAVRAAIRLPVLTSPEAAVARLRARVERGGWW